MESICLSSASILRCESFSQTQVILLVIPTALQVLFSTSLVFTNWGAGRRHLWITAEGWIYFALSLTEMVSHILPAARDSAAVFIIFDTLLAATSFLPILFYIMFVFLFSRAELVNILPVRLQTISKLLLIIFIPAIVALNEVASFVGVSHRVFEIGNKPVLAVGFKSEKDQILWTFFMSVTLALLAAYQAINFMFAFYRLIKAVLDQQRIEATSSDKSHLFRGIGWISAALKIGAIETVVGFAEGNFGTAFTRRILRFLARAFLCIGLVKGVDSVEDFQQVRDELSAGNHREFRRSRLREFISNPRLSTFQQLTPTATAFHSNSRAPTGLSRSSPRIADGLPGMRQFAAMKQSAFDVRAEKRSQRVTIQFNEGAPTLHMRFSALEFPTPVFNARSSPQPEGPPVSRLIAHPPASHHVYPLHGPPPLSPLDIANSGQGLTGLPRSHNPPPNHTRMESAYSIPESHTSLSDVRELAAQFPELPARALRTIRYSPMNNPHIGNVSNSSHSPSISKGKPVSNLSTTPLSNPFGSNEELPITTPISVPPSQPIRVLRKQTAERNHATPPEKSTFSPDTDDGFLDLGTALHSGKSRELMRDSDGTTRPAVRIDYNAITPIDRLPSIVAAEGRRSLARAPSDATSRRESTNTLHKSGDMDALAIPWLKNPEGEKEGQNMTRVKTRTSQLTKIKSVGKAPRRSTPAPIKTTFMRGSLHIEPIVIPPRQANKTEIIQGSLDSAYDRNVLRDSEVLGTEDSSFTHTKGGDYF